MKNRLFVLFFLLPCHTEQRSILYRLQQDARGGACSFLVMKQEGIRTRDEKESSNLKLQTPNIKLQAFYVLLCLTKPQSA